MFDLLMLMAHKQSYVTVIGYLSAVIQARLQCHCVRHVRSHSSQHIQDYDTSRWSYYRWNVV